MNDGEVMFVCFVCGIFHYFIYIICFYSGCRHEALAKEVDVGR